MHLYVYMYVWYVSALGTNLRVLGIFRNKIISALALSTGDESETETADREVRWKGSQGNQNKCAHTVTYV